MRELNKLRLLAGIKIDGSIEKTIREKQEDLVEPTLEGAKRYHTAVKSAVDHVKAAIKILKGLPQISNATDNVRYANELQEILSADGGQAGLTQMLDAAKKKLDKSTTESKLRDKLSKIDDLRKKADEEEEALAWEIADQENEEDYDLYGDEGPLGRKSLGYRDAKQYVPSQDDDGLPEEDCECGENEEDCEYAENEEDAARRKALDAITKIEQDTIAKRKSLAAKRRIGEIERKMMADRSQENKEKEENEEDDNGPGYYGFTGTTRSGTKGGFSVKAKNRSDAWKVAQEKHPGFIQMKCLGRDREMDKVMAREGVYYDKEFPLSHEDNEGQPGNVVSKNDKETVWKNMPQKPKDKDESPNQLDALGDPSSSDHDKKVAVPTSIKKALKDEVADIRSKIDAVSVNDQATKLFYADLANALEELHNHLAAGTVGDIKKAQIFMSSLMGPILHKIPAEAVNFIAQGGQQRSLKDYMNKVKQTGQ